MKCGQSEQDRNFGGNMANTHVNRTGRQEGEHTAAKGAEP
jgi:hypothetical protein